MTRVLLLGKNGQVGSALAPILALRHELVAWGREDCDLENLSALRERIDALQPAAIVNAAAYTAVDRAESEPQLAERLNAEVPALLATWCAAQGAVLVHYSTDYVFDGNAQRPYREDDPTAPLNVYGRTKRAGEQAVLEVGTKALVLRTSWVYGVRGGNFLKTILRAATERESLRVVADQTGAPTGTQLIAQVSVLALEALLAGKALPPLLHLTAKGATTWHAYAQRVLATAQAWGWPLRCPPQAVAAIASCDYPTPAARPRYSLLDTRRLEEALNVRLPPWEEEVDRTVAALVGFAAPWCRAGERVLEAGK